MPALTTPPLDRHWLAADFALQATNGHTYQLADIKGDKATLVMFMCNHCPFVRRMLTPLSTVVQALHPLGVGVVGINANDPITYPQDNYAAMQALAEQHNLPYPYCFDTDQSVARAYGAVCTPDFFGFDADLRLVYRGRFSAAAITLDSTAEALADLENNDLLAFMADLARTGVGDGIQYPSVGCSIKWAHEQL